MIDVNILIYITLTDTYISQVASINTYKIIILELF